MLANTVLEISPQVVIVNVKCIFLVYIQEIESGETCSKDEDDFNLGDSVTHLTDWMKTMPSKYHKKIHFTFTITTCLSLIHI